MDTASHSDKSPRAVGCFPIGCAFIIGGNILVIIAILYWETHRAHTIAGHLSDRKSLAAVEGLSKYGFLFPEDAKNIEYFASLDMYYLIAAFDLDKAKFLEWANSHGWEVAPKKGIFVDSQPLENGEYRDIPRFDGLFYRGESHKERVASDTMFADTMVAFDPLKQRAYIRYVVARRR